MHISHFTSDMHYGHANIIGFANRPFANVEAMKALIAEDFRPAPLAEVDELVVEAMTGRIATRDQSRGLSGRAGSEDARLREEREARRALISMQSTMNVAEVPRRRPDDMERKSQLVRDYIAGRADAAALHEEEPDADE